MKRKTIITKVSQGQSIANEVGNTSDDRLPTSTELNIHHPGGGNRLWWTRTGSSQGVDDGDGVANPSGRRLVELQWSRLTLVRGNVWVGGRGEREGRVGDLDLAGLRTRFWGSARQRGTIRGSRVDGHVVVLGEEVWAEFQVIVEIKGPLSLEAGAERRECCGLLLLPHTAELLVRVLRHPWRPTTSTAVVRGGRGSICGCWVEVGVVTVEGRHYRCIYGR